MPFQDLLDEAAEFDLKDRLTRKGMSQTKIRAYKAFAKGAHIKIRIGRWNDGGSIWAVKHNASNQVVYIADQRLKGGLDPVLEHPEFIHDVACIIPEYKEPKIFFTSTAEQFDTNVEEAVAAIFGATREDMFGGLNKNLKTKVRSDVARELEHVDGAAEGL